MKIETKSSNSGLSPQEINERNDSLKERLDNYNEVVNKNK